MSGGASSGGSAGSGSKSKSSSTCSAAESFPAWRETLMMRSDKHQEMNSGVLHPHNDNDSGLLLRCNKESENGSGNGNYDKSDCSPQATARLEENDDIDAQTAMGGADVDADEPPPALDWSTLNSTLYDRQSQQQELLEAFERACRCNRTTTATSTTADKDSDKNDAEDDHVELVLITGPAGYGKTALARTLHTHMMLESSATTTTNNNNKTTTNQRDAGFFVTGKFEQFLERPPGTYNYDYFPIVQALTEFVEMVLARDHLEKQETQTTSTSTILRSIQKAVTPLILETDNILLQLIPALSRIVNPPTMAKQQENDTEQTAAIATPTKCNQQQQQQQHRALGGAHQTTQLLHTFRRFIKAICSPQRPLVMFLDDLQWADPASLGLITALLHGVEGGAREKNRASDWRIPGFLIVGTCRGNEVSMDHPLAVTLRELESTVGDNDGPSAVHIRTIEVSELSHNAIFQLINHLFGLQGLQQQEKAYNLATFVLDATGGNCLNVQLFLRLLVQDGLIRWDRQLRQWDWKEEGLHDAIHHLQQLQSSQQRRMHNNHDDEPANTEKAWSWQIASSCIQRLPAPTQEVLAVASCIGAEFDQRILTTVLQSSTDASLPVLSSQLQQPLLGDDWIAAALEDAHDKGLIRPHSTDQAWGETLMMMLGESGANGRRLRWRFTHDYIQKGAYSLRSAKEMERLHLKIGRTLLLAAQQQRSGPNDSRIVSELDEETYQVITNQLCRGAEGVQAPEDRDQLAHILLQAGIRAMSSSAFRTASSHLQLAIRLLSSRHWRDQYHLSLDLYSAAAEVEYCNTNYERMDELIGAVLANARCETDKTPALTTSIYSLGSRNHLQDAIDLGMQTLRNLGEPIPSSAPRIILATLRGLQQVLASLQSMTDEEIKSIPPMEGRERIGAMRILCLMYPDTLNGRPILAPLISIRMVQMTLQHGLSKMACVGFSSLAMLLCNGVFGGGNTRIDLGMRLGNLSLQMESKEWISRLYSSVYGFCFCVRQPLRLQLRPLLLSHRVGLSTGDIQHAMLSAAIYVGLALHASVSLPQLIMEATAFLDVMRLHKQANMIQLMTPNLQLMLNLRGDCDTDGQYSLSGRIMKEEEAMKDARDTKNATKTALLLLDKLILLGYTAQFEKAAETARAIDKVDTSSLVAFVKGTRYLLSGLAVLAAPPKFGRSRLAYTSRCLRILKSLAQQSPHNYQNKVALLEAEIARVRGNLDLALQRYDHSIACAEKAFLWNEMGLACERAATALTNCGHQYDVTRIRYLERAVLAYEDWGADAVVARLKRVLPVTTLRRK